MVRRGPYEYDVLLLYLLDGIGRNGERWFRSGRGDLRFAQHLRPQFGFGVIELDSDSENAGERIKLLA